MGAALSFPWDYPGQRSSSLHTLNVTSPAGTLLSPVTLENTRLSSTALPWTISIPCVLYVPFHRPCGHDVIVSICLTRKYSSPRQEGLPHASSVSHHTLCTHITFVWRLSLPRLADNAHVTAGACAHTGGGPATKVCEMRNTSIANLNSQPLKSRAPAHLQRMPLLTGLPQLQPVVLLGQRPPKRCVCLQVKHGQLAVGADVRQA